MGEDLSQAYRMGIAFLILSWLLIATGVVLQSSTAIQDSFINKVDYSLSSAEGVAIRSVAQVESVGAPTAYKAIVENKDSIDSLTIRYLNGTSTSDYKSLLKNADKFVRVIVDQRGSKFKVKVEEVKR